MLLPLLFSCGKNKDDTGSATEAVFWDINYTASFSKNFSFTAGDIIAGILWLRNGGGENLGQIYLAYKTATDNWATEESMNMNLIGAFDGGKNICFYGEAVNEEN